MEFTWFGYLYLTLTAVTCLWLITTIGNARDDVTHTEVVTRIVVTGLLLWGLLAVGLTH